MLRFSRRMRSKAFALGLVMAAAVAQAATLYVSPEGRDGAPGTLDRPLGSATHRWNGMLFIDANLHGPE